MAHLPPRIPKFKLYRKLYKYYRNVFVVHGCLCVSMTTDCLLPSFSPTIEIFFTVHLHCISYFKVALSIFRCFSVLLEKKVDLSLFFLCGLRSRAKLSHLVRVQRQHKRPRKQLCFDTFQVKGVRVTKKQPLRLFFF